MGFWWNYFAGVFSVHELVVSILEQTPMTPISFSTPGKHQLRLRRVASARNLSRVVPLVTVWSEDAVRQAKAAKRHGASCPTVSMAPVLAITSVVARTLKFFDPVGEFF